MVGSDQISAYIPLVVGIIAFLSGLEVQRRTHNFELRKEMRSQTRLDAAVRTQVMALLRLEAFYVRLLFQLGDPSVALPIWSKVHDSLRARLAQLDVAQAFTAEQCEKIYMVLIIGDIAIELQERTGFPAKDELDLIRATRHVQSGVKPLFDSYIELFNTLADETELASFAHSAKERVKYAVLLDEPDDFLAF